MHEKTPSQEPPSSPQNFFAGKRVLWVIFLVIAVLAGVSFVGRDFFHSDHDHAEEGQSAVKYICPMHPSIIDDKPGSCPICGMDLVKIENSEPTQSVKSGTPPKNELDDLFGDSSDSGGERTILFYRNPMDPTITSHTPDKDEMGMDYVPVYSDEIDAAPQAVEGMATIRVGEEALRLSGVQTAEAKVEEVARSVRTVGIVVPDETRIRHVHTKIEGWIETLHTNFTGQIVTRDQPLLSIYSPELLTTQEEFLAARAAAVKFASSSSADVKALGHDLLRSARKRLELFDVPSDVIDELEKSGTVQRTVTLNAPVSGFVTSKGIYEGQMIEPGLELFTITDLSHVWIEADLYEYEAGAVHLGQEATLTLAYDPGIELKGTVAYVFPYLSSDSRTLKVRFDFPNPDLALKPQMYVDVTLALAKGVGVTIPDSAVIDSGVRQVAFVETAPGSFEPRQIKSGVRGGGKIQVLAGVKAGEKVVVKANFLLDSESKLRAALIKMTGGGAQ